MDRHTHTRTNATHRWSACSRRAPRAPISCTHARVYIYILYYICSIYIYACVCVRGAWWAGQRAAAHQWWASYKVRIAQSFIVFITTTTTTWWEGACLSCTPACLLLLWQQAGGGGTARISTRPPLTAASQQDTPIHTHTRNTPLIGRRGAFEWWRCAPVVCPRHPYLYIYTWPVIGTSEALLEREPNAHTYTHARRESCGGGCESVQATRTKTMYRERERE